MSEDRIRLNHDDLYSARVEGYLEEHRVLHAGVADLPEQPIVLKVIYSSWFYLALAAGLGAFTAWAILEPWFDDSELVVGEGFHLVAFLLFPTVAAFIGLFLGAAEGIMCRQHARAGLCALVGLGMGFVGGLISLFAAGMVYAVMVGLALSVSKPTEDGMPTGVGFFILMMGRSVAWALAAIPAGIGQGIALREPKVIINGLIGAVLGGLLGGLLFDPIYMLLASRGDAAVSRAVGLTLIGIMVGLFVGLVELWTKTAWLKMKAGSLAGKQFVLYRNPTVVGSSPKADIYIFKDKAIEPRHALIHNRGGRFEIEDQNTPDGTYVNGRPVTRAFLESGDQIVMGQTVLEFSLKETV